MVEGDQTVRNQQVSEETEEPVDQGDVGVAGNTPLEEEGAGPSPPKVNNGEVVAGTSLSNGENTSNLGALFNNVEANGLASQREGLLTNNASDAAIAAKAEEEKPSDEEKAEFQKEAKEGLDKQLGALVSPEDRAKAQAMQEAILKGDTAALGQIIAGMTPEQVKNFSSEIQKNLDRLGAGVTVKPTGDGSSLFVHERGSSTGLVVDKQGNSRPVSVKEGPDGRTHIDNTSTPTDTAQEVAASISDAATLNSRPRTSMALPGIGNGGGDQSSGEPQPNPNMNRMESTDSTPIIRFPRLREQP